MKKFFFLLLVFSSTLASAQWSHVSCILSGTPYAIGSDSTSVLYGTYEGVSQYISSDRSWHMVDAGNTPGGEAIAGNDKILAIFGSPISYIFTSTNFGASWKSSTTPFSSVTGCAFYQKVICFFDEYLNLWYSADEGTTWKSIASMMSSPGDPVLSAFMNNELYSIRHNSANEYWLCRNTFDGTYFTSTENITKLTVTPIAFTSSHGGLFITTFSKTMVSWDNGITWGTLGNTIHGDILCADSKNLYVVNGDLSSKAYSFESKEWKNIKDNTVETACFGACYNGAFMGWKSDYNSGLLCYENDEWKEINALPVGSQIIYTGLRSAGNKVFTGIYEQMYGFSGPYIYVSDNAVSFYPLKGSVITKFNDAAKAGDNWLVAGDNGICRVNFQDSTLNPVFGSREVFSFAIFKNVLYAGTDGGVYASVDDGLTWAYKSMSGKVVHKLKTFEESLFAGTSDGLFVSATGTDWAETECPPLEIFDIASSFNDIYALTVGGIIHRVDTLGGKIWLPIGTAIVGTDVTSIVTHGERLYAGTNHGSVMYSENKGQSWTDISDPDWGSVVSLDIHWDFLMAAEKTSAIWYTYAGKPFGITNMDNQAELKIFPNPADDKIRIITKLKNYEYKITDIAGRIMISGRSLSDMDFPDISELQKGLYMLNITDGKISSSAKVIKE